MGQYYNPTNIDKEPIEWLYSHKYGSGLKLMEHSWLKNDFVGAVCNLLIPGGSWYKNRIVWAGDYADGEPGTETKENPDGENLYHKGAEKGIEIQPKETEFDYKKWRYLVNWSKKVTLDMTQVTAKDKWLIHPLPLLTAEGNGRGGGDFHKEDSRVGMWARDIISIEKAVPLGTSLGDAEDVTFTEK